MARKRNKYYVTLYLINKFYAGPEEGGQWPICGVPISHPYNKRNIDSVVQAEEYVKKRSMTALVAKMNIGRPDISSSISEGRYHFIITNGPPKPFPQNWRYE